MWRCFRELIVMLNAIRNFLHVCGGVSKSVGFRTPPIRFSPRMWRCFLYDKVSEVRLENFLHVCGGVSRTYHTKMWTKKFSPRMWRCFPDVVPFRSLWFIFSTYVEVFPTRALSILPKPYFLHVCGGVSHRGCNEHERVLFSPRMWRCFCDPSHLEARSRIFSTYVEVFPYVKVVPMGE